MNETISALTVNGVLDAITWAARSASNRTLADYSEAAGHDARWLGMTRFILFEDRLDRVCSLGRYFLPEGTDAGVGRDLVYAELTPEDIERFPVLPPGLVKRADINGSPGWTDGEHPFLIQAFQPGTVDEIRWIDLSKTKQAVARQENPDQLALFPRPTEVEPAPVKVPPGAPVLVVAHSLNPSNGALEVFIGLPSSEVGKNEAWYWRHPLNRQPPLTDGMRFPTSTPPTNPNEVPDVSVRLRQTSAEARYDDSDR